MPLEGFRPMLGAKVDKVVNLRYPLMASCKLDGIRAIWWEGQFYSRTLKPIPNKELSERGRAYRVPSGWEGELIMGDPCAKDVFTKTTSAVMSRDASALGIRFYVFDNMSIPKERFTARIKTLHHVPDFAVKVSQIMVENSVEVTSMEAMAIDDGFEGLILRDPMAPYKNGRSTLDEQGLLKLKRFQDAEMEVIGFEEKMHNANQATTDARGYTKRTSHKENQIATGLLGSLVVRWQGQPLGVGSGFTDAQRAAIWAARGAYMGKFAKVKYFPSVKDMPRHPVFIGWRDKIDM